MADERLSLSAAEAQGAGLAAAANARHTERSVIIVDDQTGRIVHLDLSATDLAALNAASADIAAA